MYKRYCKAKITEAMSDTPVVIVSGPRQAGKTTMVKDNQPTDSTYITLDDATIRNAAEADPVGFIRNLNSSCTIIDEVQRVPDLFLAIKQSVDEDRRPGRFLLTGSSNAMLLPQLADSLAGRIEIINLLPLSTCEIDAVQSTFIEKIFGNVVPTSKNIRVRKQLIDKIVTGGFPEPLARNRHERRVSWYHQYINSIISKDLKDLGHIEHIEVMPKLVRLLASQVGQLVNYSDISSKIGITRPTVVNYINLLERLYIFEKLPAWHKQEVQRLVKTPKMHIVDSGLLCSLLRIDQNILLQDTTKLGHVIESYVVNEIKRLLTWHLEPIELYQYRDKDKVEVDLILENYAGQIVGIEIKASASLKGSDFEGLRRLQNIAGENFLMGLVLYDGDHSTSHGTGIYSAPIGCLWE